MSSRHNSAVLDSRFRRPSTAKFTWFSHDHSAECRNPIWGQAEPSEVLTGATDWLSEPVETVADADGN